MVPNWRRRRFETRESAECGGKGAQSERCSSRAGLASGAITRDAAHPRDIVCCVLGRKCRCRTDVVTSCRKQDVDMYTSSCGVQQYNNAEAVDYDQDLSTTHDDS